MIKHLQLISNCNKEAMTTFTTTNCNRNNYRLHMSRQLHIISNCNEQSQERSTTLFISFWLTNPNRSIPEGGRSCHCLLSSPARLAQSKAQDLHFLKPHHHITKQSETTKKPLRFCLIEGGRVGKHVCHFQN